MRLPELELIVDPVPRSGPWNMAADEWLLATASTRPRLRFYTWDQPTASLGYFERLSGLDPAMASLPGGVVRRWTGGGTVAHGDGDLTYALILPASGPADWRRHSGELYCGIHETIVAVLAGAGISASLEGEESASAGLECFRNPVRGDVILDGRKIAGAAQRRTRLGLLQQGSLQGMAFPEDFAQTFASRLAARVCPARDLLDTQADEIERLAASRYGTEEWLRRR